MIQNKMLGKSDISKETKGGGGKHVWRSERLHTEGRLNKVPRLQRKHKDEKRSKANATQNQLYTMANSTRGLLSKEKITKIDQPDKVANPAHYQLTGKNTS